MNSKSVKVDLLSKVDHIKKNLHTRQSWTKSDYEDFYLRDIEVLLRLTAYLKENDEDQTDKP